MLHLMKLAVGISDFDHLAAVQQQRVRAGMPLRHLTRNFPRRATEVIDGGSMYWVIAGTMLARQRITDIVEAKREDGSACAAIMLDLDLVPLLGRPTKAFQGWRYLPAADAPPDRSALRAAEGAAALPEAMQRDLRHLGLL